MDRKERTALYIAYWFEILLLTGCAGAITYMAVIQLVIAKGQLGAYLFVIIALLCYFPIKENWRKFIKLYKTGVQ